MTRLLAIPIFFFGVMVLSLIGMLQERVEKVENSGPEKAFVFSATVLLALAAFVLLASSGIVAVKGVLF
jgi:hypothetical protein